ncbi:integrase core domain protein [Ceratobasidium sp. AG-Ba]|nr:integrase core domain protein [Ceratobasidium sp. AG-Ba]
MSSKFPSNPIAPEFCRQRIEDWVLLVSNYQPSTIHPNMLAANDDDDDLVIIDRSASPTKKRPRSDSSLVPEHSRVVAHRRGTPFKSPSLFQSRASTPPESVIEPQSDGDTVSVADGVSEVGSSITEVIRRRDKTKVTRMKANLEDELAKCIARIKASKSDAYKAFEDPVIDYTKDPPTHYRFKCKHCPLLVPRRIGVSETSGLLGHFNRCPGRTNQATLVDDFGMTGSSAKLTREEVREFCALWVCENARPFQIINDRYLKKLLHPDARKYLPHRHTISQDIQRMYEGSQDSIRLRLEGIVGVFHIALDMLSSSNGLDFMGLVLFYQRTTQGNTLTLERFVLECLSFGGEQHTGVALARSVLAVLRKFKIQDRVWGVVCDNASNNATMMQTMESFGLKRLTGPTSRVFCMLHVLNLSAQAIASVLRKKKPTGSTSDEEDDDDSDEHNFCIDFDQEESDPQDVDEGDIENAPSWSLDDENDDELLSELELPDMDEMDIAEAARVGSVLWKLAKFAHKIRYSSRAKMAFKAACKEHDPERPHNVRRDVRTRWNSTCDMAVDADRTFVAILATQRDASLDVPRKHRLHSEDRRFIKGLVSLFKPLAVVTESLSRAGVPLLADVVLHFDSLEYEYTNIASDSDQPAYMRAGAQRARTVLNKYYEMTDQSHLYRAAILLHPSMRRQYLTLAEWPDSWIEESIDLTVKIYRNHYKPASSAPAPTRAPGTSQFGYSSYMSRMYSNLADQTQSVTCPVQSFVNAPPTIEYGEQNEPIFRNPIQWWYNQRLGGNEWDGLAQMALDVLSTPATSVDVERAFSYVGSVVSKRRHNLKPYSIQATSTLGSYSKANLVKKGCLELPRKANLKEKAKPKSKPYFMTSLGNIPRARQMLMLERMGALGKMAAIKQLVAQSFMQLLVGLIRNCTGIDILLVLLVSAIVIAADHQAELAIQIADRPQVKSAVTPPIRCCQVRPPFVSLVFVSMRLDDSLLFKAWVELVLETQGDTNMAFAYLSTTLRRLCGCWTVDLCPPQPNYPLPVNSMLSLSPPSDDSCPANSMLSVPPPVAIARETITHARPFDLLVGNYVSLPEGHGGFKTVLVLTDVYSRYIFAFMSKKSGTGKFTTDALDRISDLILTPRVFMADGGSHFNCDEVRRWAEGRGSKVIKTPPYAPWANGLAEGSVKLLINRLKKLCAPSVGEDPDDVDDARSTPTAWPKHLTTAVSQLNDRVLDSLGYTPRELMTGQLSGERRAELGRAIITRAVQDADTNLALTYSLCQDAYARALEHAAKRKRVFDKKARVVDYQLGDLVQKYDARLDETHSLMRKLAPRWSGPLRIVDKSANSYKLEDLEGNVFTQAAHARLIRPFIPRPGSTLDRYAHSLKAARTVDRSATSPNQYFGPQSLPRSPRPERRVPLERDDPTQPNKYEDEDDVSPS